MFSWNSYLILLLNKYLHNDVVDWNVNKFNEESNESHYAKTNGSSNGNLLKFCNNKEYQTLHIKNLFSIILTCICLIKK